MVEVITAENISAGYDGRHVIKSVSFTVGSGDVVAVLGPNGSGKTTLLRAVLGMMSLKEGRVRLFGHVSGGPELEGRVSYIPQRMQLDRTFPITLGEMLQLSKHAPELERYIDMLELRKHLGKKVGDLSGGLMQRALLAYALIKGPGLLIMDEPTSWVDARGTSCILCIIEELKNRGAAVLFVSHDYSAIKSVCTHVLGVGHEGHFFERADSATLNEKINALFGPIHHGGAEIAGPYCAHCGEPTEKEEK